MEHIYQIYDQIVETFEKLSASDQTRNMSDTSSDGMEQMVDPGFSESHPQRRGFWESPAAPASE